MYVIRLKTKKPNKKESKTHAVRMRVNIYRSNVTHVLIGREWHGKANNLSLKKRSIFIKQIIRFFWSPLFSISKIHQDKRNKKSQYAVFFVDIFCAVANV